MTYSSPPPAPISSPADDGPLPGATFGQAISRFYRRYATFSGRASRSEYWWVALFFALVLLVGSVLAVVLGAATAQTPGDMEEPGPLGVVVMLLLLVVLLGSLVPSLALNARRLHDANFSGWVQLVCLIPSLGGLVMMAFALMPSSPAGASYDKNPPVGSPYGY